MTDQPPLGFAPLASLLGVTTKQMFMWHQRRATTHFPEAVASVHIPTYAGAKRKAPLFDMFEVVDWFSDYDPNRGRGAHWKQKREQTGKPMANRGRKWKHGRPSPGGLPT